MDPGEGLSALLEQGLASAVFCKRGAGRGNEAGLW
jgi:hypothetical protein